MAKPITAWSTGSVLRESVLLARLNWQLALVFIALNGIPASTAILQLDEFSAFCFGVVWPFVMIPLNVFIIRRCLISNKPMCPSADSFVMQCIFAVLQALIAVVAIFTGLLFLIVPGVILYLRWSVALPILVSSKSGVIKSLKQSWTITKGRTLTILGALAVPLFFPLALVIGLPFVGEHPYLVVFEELLWSVYGTWVMFASIAIFLKLQNADAEIA